jgi:bacteriocin-like protein
MTITSAMVTLTDDELDAISGGATKLFDVRIPGLTLQYYDNGTAVGTSWWGTVVNNNGSTTSQPGMSGGVIGF